MWQPQNPSQNSDDSSSDPPSAFLISRKNPYDHPEQAYSPSTEHKSSYGRSERTSSLLIDANAVLGIERQLSSGWYSCYKWSLYLFTLSKIFYHWLYISFLFDSSLTLVLIIKIIQLVIEVVFTVLMINILKTKKLEKAGWGFKLAVAGFVLLFLQISVKALRVIKRSSDETKDDFQKYFIISFGYLLYYSLSIVFPAWKIKKLNEKKETLLQKDVDLYDN